MKRGKGFYRSAFYAPSLLGASMSIALVWRAVFNDGGTVDNLPSAPAAGSTSPAGRCWPSRC